MELVGYRTESNPGMWRALQCSLLRAFWRADVDHSMLFVTFNSSLLRRQCEGGRVLWVGQWQCRAVHTTYKVLPAGVCSGGAGYNSQEDLSNSRLFAVWVTLHKVRQFAVWVLDTAGSSSKPWVSLLDLMLLCSFVIDWGRGIGPDPGSNLGADISPSSVLCAGPCPSLQAVSRGRREHTGCGFLTHSLLRRSANIDRPLDHILLPSPYHLILFFLFKVLHLVLTHSLLWLGHLTHHCAPW